MKNLIELIAKSIYDPEFYRELPLKPSSFSWKYYVGLTLLLSVFVTIVSGIPLVLSLSNVLHDLPRAVSEYYPDDLELNIQNGVVTTNVPEPYRLPLPTFLRGEFATDTISSFAVIDTNTPITLSQFESSKALVVVSSSTIAFYNAKKGMRVTSFSQSTNYSINETHLQGIMYRIEPYFVYVAPVTVLLIFLAMMISFAVNLVFLLLDALIVFIFGKYLKRHWTYGDVYRMCLHATTLPLIVSITFLMLPIGGVRIPYLSSILLLAIVFANVRSRANDRETPSTPKTEV